MVLVLVIVILLGLCSSLTKGFAARLPVESVFQGGLASNSVKEVYDSFYSISDKKEENEEMNVVSHIQRVDLNKVKYRHVYDVSGEDYVLVKTSRRRNKRFTSYHTLCPFKICNMGRKRRRTTRYIQEIRVPGDNEDTGESVAILGLYHCRQR